MEDSSVKKFGINKSQKCDIISLYNGRNLMTNPTEQQKKLMAAYINEGNTSAISAHLKNHIERTNTLPKLWGEDDEQGKEEDNNNNNNNNNVKAK